MKGFTKIQREILKSSMEFREITIKDIYNRIGSLKEYKDEYSNIKKAFEFLKIKPNINNSYFQNIPKINCFFKTGYVFYNEIFEKVVDMYQTVWNNNGEIKEDDFKSLRNSLANIVKELRKARINPLKAHEEFTNHIKEIIFIFRCNNCSNVINIKVNNVGKTQICSSCGNTHEYKPLVPKRKRNRIKFNQNKSKQDKSIDNMLLTGNIPLSSDN